ncbi:HCN2, partial [Symbiodinium microadriaticum]
VRSDISSVSRRLSDRASDQSRNTLRKDPSSQDIWPVAPFEPGVKAAAPPREGSFVPEPPSSVPSVLMKNGRTKTDERGTEVEDLPIATTKASAKIARICDQPISAEVLDRPNIRENTSSKDSWNDGMVPRSFWNIDNASSPAQTMRRRSLASATVGSFKPDPTGSQQDLNLKAFGMESRSRWADFVIHPHCTPRIVWDIFGMLFLMRDILFIPLQLFDLPEYQTMAALATLSLLFWTMDIALSFFTGYYEKGRLELTHRKIAFNYITTWFFLDIGVVGIDWWLETTETADGSEGVARVTKSIRSARFFRMFRLIRLSKMSKVSAFLREQIATEAGIIQFGILR